MDAQLEERLARLGGSVQEPVGVAPTDEMWTRGRRRVQARRAAGAVTTLALAAVLGSAALVAADVTRTEAVPVSAERGAVLPKKLAFTVPESLPTLGAGEVSAVGTRERETGRLFWGGHVSEVVGVQATTGAYGVIETPGRVESTFAGLSLSPDGSRLAYWANDDPDAEYATRLVVRNLTDGTSVDHDVEADFGVDPASDLFWLGGDELLASQTRYTDAEHAGAESTGADWFTVGPDGTLGKPQLTEFWPSSNVVDGKYLTQRGDSGNDGRSDLAVVDPISGENTAMELPLDPEREVHDLVWDGFDAVAVLLDDTPNVSGDNDLEVGFALLRNRGKGQTPEECGSSPDATCSYPEWTRSGVKVSPWSSLVGMRDGGVVVNQGTSLDVVSTADAGEGTIEKLVTLRDGDGSFDTADRGRGGAVQEWVFAHDVVTTAELVDAVEPAVDLPRAVLAAAPLVALVALWALGLGALAFLAKAGVAVARRPHGNA